MLVFFSSFLSFPSFPRALGVGESLRTSSINSNTITVLRGVGLHKGCRCMGNTSVQVQAQAAARLTCLRNGSA
jgi:hypothetical protein